MYLNHHFFFLVWFPVIGRGGVIITVFYFVQWQRWKDKIGLSQYYGWHLPKRMNGRTLYWYLVLFTHSNLPSTGYSRERILDIFVSVSFSYLWYSILYLFLVSCIFFLNRALLDYEEFVHIIDSKQKVYSTGPNCIVLNILLDLSALTDFEWLLLLRGIKIQSTSVNDWISTWLELLYLPDTWIEIPCNATTPTSL